MNARIVVMISDSSWGKGAPCQGDQRSRGGAIVELLATTIATPGQGQPPRSPGGWPCQTVASHVAAAGREAEAVEALCGPSDDARDRIRMRRPLMEREGLLDASSTWSS